MIAAPDAAVRFYGQVFFDGVHDSSEVSFTGGSSSTSADAFGMSIGGGADVRVTRRFSIGPSIDYVPIFFGDKRQDHWRVGVGGRFHF